MEVFMPVIIYFVLHFVIHAILRSVGHCGTTLESLWKTSWLHVLLGIPAPYRWHGWTFLGRNFSNRWFAWWVLVLISRMRTEPRPLCYNANWTRGGNMARLISVDQVIMAWFFYVCRETCWGHWQAPSPPWMNKTWTNWRSSLPTLVKKVKNKC